MVLTTTINGDGSALASNGDAYLGPCRITCLFKITQKLLIGYFCANVAHESGQAYDHDAFPPHHHYHQWRHHQHKSTSRGFEFGVEIHHHYLTSATGRPAGHGGAGSDRVASAGQHIIHVSKRRSKRRQNDSDDQDNWDFFIGAITVMGREIIMWMEMWKSCKREWCWWFV